MSNPRKTRSTSKMASGIGDAFVDIAQSSSSQLRLSPPAGRSDSATSDYVLPPRDKSTAEEDEADREEDPEPVEIDNSDHEAPKEPAREEEPQDKFLSVLTRLADNFDHPSKPKSRVKHRNPDSFDGTDPSKLDTFMFQCQLYIAACTHDFPDDESRVSFSLSYLKGVPLDWFQGEVARCLEESGTLPKWFTSYKLFIQELKRLFGPRDPANDATNALEALRYKDSTKAARYLIDFNRHAHRTGWNETALTRQFYKGLPDRLKDEISRLGKPTTLRTLQDLTAILDERYWERQTEISRDKRSTNNPNHSNNKPTSPDTRNDRSSNQASNGSKPNHSNNNQSKNKDSKKLQPVANSSNQGNKTNTIADILGPDGKLKPEERQRRMDNNLCLRCGKTGHKVNDCPVVTKPKPKGRAATVSTPSASTPVAAASGKA